MRVARKLTVPRLLETLSRTSVAAPATPLGIRSQRGSASAAFPGGTTTSAIVEIKHGLGVSPDHVNVTTIGSEASTTPITGRILSRSPEAVKVRLFAPSAIAATTIEFTWEVVAD